MANEAVSTKEKTKQNKPNVFDIFIEGARIRVIFPISF